MMRKILRALFWAAYAALLCTGVWISRGFSGVLSASAQPPQAISRWKESLEVLLPPHDNTAVKDVFLLNGREIFPAFKITSQEDSQGQLLEFFDPAGFAFRVEKKGPYGTSAFLVAVDAGGRLSGVRPVSLSEPRGLGPVFEKAGFFWDSFKGRSADELELTVRGGKIPPVLGGVEISQRYAETVRRGLENYLKEQDSWKAEAMKGRRTFEELKQLQALEFQTSPPVQETHDEELFSAIF